MFFFLILIVAVLTALRLHEVLRFEKKIFLKESQLARATEADFFQFTEMLLQQERIIKRLKGQEKELISNLEDRIQEINAALLSENFPAVLSPADPIKNFIPDFVASALSGSAADQEVVKKTEKYGYDLLENISREIVKLKSLNESPS